MPRPRMPATLGLTLAGAVALAAASGDAAPQRRQPTATPAAFASAAPVDDARVPAPAPDPAPPELRHEQAAASDGADHGIRRPRAGPDVNDAQVLRPARPTDDPAADPDPAPAPTPEAESPPRQEPEPRPEPEQQPEAETPEPPPEPPDPKPEPSSDPHAGAVSFELLQATRASAGAPPLIRDPHADAVAQAWAQELAETGRLRHNPSFDTELAAGLAGSSYAENVGQAASGDPAAVHAAFEASPSHLANITGDFSHVGVGAAVSADGTLWVVHDLVAVD